MNPGQNVKFNQPGANIFLPKGGTYEDAARAVTHLGIGAHQDDLEFMAYHGIAECFQAADRSFGGVICTNGAGSARTGPYANYSGEEMRAIRQQEQRTAAQLGDYGLMAQLDYPTADLKVATDHRLSEDLIALLAEVKPAVVYTHSPADKHETHLVVLREVLRALRSLPVESRPKKVLGCEVWRDLDWMLDEEKVAMDVSARPHLAAALNGVFDSQIAGGKRYDLATEGRRRANATYFTSHAVDQATHLAFAMDLTPLVQDDQLDPVAYTLGFIDRFRQDVSQKLTQALGL